MRWEEAVPHLQRRLDAEGLPGPAQVVTRLPVHIYALLFFVPVLNYVLMVTLSVLPTAAVPEWRRTAPVSSQMLG